MTHSSMIEPRPSWLDRANPLSRLLAAFICSLPLIATVDWVTPLVTWAGLVMVYALARGDLVAYARRLGLLVVLAALSAVTTILYASPAGDIHWRAGFITISDQSLLFGLAIGLRILALGSAAIIGLSGVDPTAMAAALSQIAHLPARFVLGTLAGMRLIGRLRADWQTMAAARRARGLGDHRALRRFAGLSFALLVSAIRRGSTLATAMEARGFGAGPRTWATRSTLTWRDPVVIAVACLIMALALTCSVTTGQFRWIADI